MPPMKKQKRSALEQSTISKFFGVDNSKQKTKKRDAPKEDDSDQPVKLTKVEISSSTTLRKGSVLSSATVDRIKQFSYQEDQPRKETSLSESVKDSDVPDVLFDVFQEKETNPAASVTISDDDDDEEDDEKMEINEKKISRTKCTDSSKKTKYTPLEQQYLDFKREYPDAILFIECGYKYRLFGEDAQVASKILNIGCYVSHNFVSASIPTHRLSVHVRRLVANGQKVGVVKQTETAALKAAGDNKNTLFSRKLHALYTTSTLIGEDFNISPSAEEVTSDEATPLSGYLTCIYDTSSSKEKTATVCVGIISVNSTTGDVLYSSFDDTISRSLLESCLMQIDPVEIIHPESALTERTMNLIRNFCDISLISNKKIRIEKLDDELFDYTNALKIVSEFFENCNSAEKKATVNTNSPAVLSGVLSLPPVIICCISSLISYLSEFRLEKLLRNWKQWQSLSDSSTFMALNAAAVRNLEVLKNSVDGTAYGSLLWTLNFTRTKFGENLLKSWLTKPLKDLRAIEERQDAVMEVLNSQSNVWEVVKKLLSRLPNLEKLLCAAFYHRCTCLEFITLVKTLIDVKQELHTVSERITIEVQGSKIKQMISDIISLLENIEGFAENINEKAAKEEDKTKIFIDTLKYAEVTRCQADIKNIENKLNQLKPSICRTLRLPAFSYSTVMGQKYLIEVKNNILPLVPTSWMKMSSTKQVSRFRSPEVEVLYNELRQLLEELKEHCVQAWNSLLDEFSTYFYKYKKVIAYLAQLDCIIAFAKLAGQEGYCRPVLTNDEGRVLNIVQGRNPIVSKLLGETHQYVANDTKLDVNKRCMIVTGPNMGGKSSYVRQVALISILAQAGSYVPATEAQLPIFDGIYIRMGADDDVVQERRSTFFTEMLETSGILSKASHHSLVILDELGRGTSTHDGSAIAQATLDHLIKQVRCITLFVTHYPDIANQLQTVYPENILSCHMAFVTDSSSENPAEEPDVTFLYTIVTGIASQSYGINAAKLAGIESDILMKAKQKSLEFENYMKKRRFICSVVNNIMHSNTSKLKNLQLV